MITETGEELDIVILTETGKDWQAFATWYSALKSLPDARTFICCARTQDCPYQYYQWTKRLNVKTIHLSKLHEDDRLNKLLVFNQAYRRFQLRSNVLMVYSSVLFIDVLDPNLLTVMTKSDPILWTNDSVWCGLNLTEEFLDETINAVFLEGKDFQTEPPFAIVKEAKETETVHPIVSYEKGCGLWINTLKGCPLANAAGLVGESMTVNENRIIELWKRMVPLYNAVG